MKIIMLTSNGDSSRFLYNGINERFAISNVIIEKKKSKYLIIRRKISSFGFLYTLNQILFQIFIPNILWVFSKNRLKNIIKKYSLSNNNVPYEKIINVKSINDIECLEHLLLLKPDLIIVSGTRILSDKLISSINAPFINIHVGITPKYRGVHGAYWALFNKDLDNCGVTIHIIDKGIDTGKVIRQKKIIINQEDNFTTYPLIQYGVGIKLFNEVIHEFSINQVTFCKKNITESKLYYHPTLTSYLYCFIKYNIK